ncbi:MAG: hypothetical protein V4550_07385 [Gemmatimonadota bacterium]
MSRIGITLTLAAALAAGPVLAAQPAPGQGPPPNGRGMGPGRPGPGPGPGFASVLLARTGELKLTDQQVTRLAGIARQASERHKANQVALDSLLNQDARARADRPEDRPAGPPPAARALLDRVRTQEHNDLRDALAILTPEQLATAFELSRGGPGGRPGPNGPGGPAGGQRGMRPGMAGPMGPGAGPRGGSPNGPPNGPPNGGAQRAPGARPGPP